MKMKVNTPHIKIIESNFKTKIDQEVKKTTKVQESKEEVRNYLI